MLPKGSNETWIRPANGGWFVGIGNGHYNEPLSRDEALQRARSFCAERSTTEILVFDAKGLLIERVQV